MENYPQELAQDAVCQSHTGHMTGLWFLPARPLRLNTNEWMNEWMTVFGHGGKFDWASGFFWNLRYKTKAAFWRLLYLTNAPMIVRQVNACYTLGLCGKCTRSDMLVNCWPDHCDPVPTTCVFDRGMWLSTYCSVCLPVISECSEHNRKSLSWWVETSGHSLNLCCVGGRRTSDHCWTTEMLLLRGQYPPVTDEIAFLDVLQRRLVVIYRRFGTTCSSHLQRSRNGLLDLWRWEGQWDLCSSVMFCSVDW